MDPEERSREISRRRMLRRIGVGAVVAWTAPIVTSVHAPAFAASPACSCPPFDCIEGQGAMCPGSQCFCAPHRGPGQFPCTCFTGPPSCTACTSDQDCPPRFACVDVGPTCGCAGNTACVSLTCG